MNFSKSVKAALAVKPMTQTAMAEKLGSKQDMVSKQLNRRDVTMMTWVKYADMFHVELSDFIKLGAE